MDYVVLALPNAVQAGLDEIEADVRALVVSLNERWAAESESG